jgi:amphi-Trp domain-containing protein
MSTERFKHESLEDSDTIIKYLNALKEGFESGTLSFASDDQKLVVKPRGLINLDVEARRKGDEIKLHLKMRWTEDVRPTETKTAPLIIDPKDKV